MCILKWQLNKINLLSINNPQWEIPKSGNKERKRRGGGEEKHPSPYSFMSMLQVVSNSFSCCYSSYLKT